MGEALWDNLKRIKMQRQWREQGVSERWAKRQRREDDEAMRPFAPSMTTHAEPSSTSNPAPTPAPPVPPPVQPSPPRNKDTEMTDADATNEAHASKGKGCEPKN